MIRRLYIDLMIKCLTNTIYEDISMDRNIYDPLLRKTGQDWPSCAHTMIGEKRLRNIVYAIECVIRENIPGDFIETGVWRG